MDLLKPVFDAIPSISNPAHEFNSSAAACAEAFGSRILHFHIIAMGCVMWSESD